MTDEFEKALHRALRPQADPGEDFAARVVTRLDSDAEPAAPAARVERMRHAASRSRWFPVALAACLIAAIGFFQMRQHARDATRANQARAQLLQALSIASDNVNIVRATVAREEHPDS